jgi:hypothetical protein
MPAPTSARTTRLLISPLSTISATSRLAASVTRSPSMRISGSPSFSCSSVIALPPPWTITGKWPSTLTACTAFGQAEEKGWVIQLVADQSTLRTTNIALVGVFIGHAYTNPSVSGRPTAILKH